MKLKAVLLGNVDAINTGLSGNPAAIYLIRALTGGFLLFLCLLSSISPSAPCWSAWWWYLPIALFGAAFAHIIFVGAGIYFGLTLLGIWEDARDIALGIAACVAILVYSQVKAVRDWWHE